MEMTPLNEMLKSEVMKEFLEYKPYVDEIKRLGYDTPLDYVKKRYSKYLDEAINYGYEAIYDKIDVKLFVSDLGTDLFIEHIYYEKQLELGLCSAQ